MQDTPRKNLIIVMQTELPPEVIATILAKLEDLSALLNCRLVCRSWNDECLSLLRRSRFRKTVVPSPLNIQKAVQFGNHEGQFILPFGLDQTLNLRKDSETAENFEEKCVAEFQTMSQDIARLMEICGPDCIREYRLEYSGCGAKGLVALNKFLGLISFHLEKFDLTFDPLASLSRRQTVQVLRSDPVLFPNLNELFCETFPNCDEEVELEDIESVLIENSHNLETLALKARGVQNYWPKQSPAAFKTLRTLDSEKLGLRVQFLENIRFSKFEPILETFVFNAAVDEEEEGEELIALTGTLEMFSKTLKSIKMTLGPTARSVSVALPFRFPSSLPKLENLALIFQPLHFPFFVDPQEFNFSQATFPALHSVQIPFGCMLATPPPRPHSAQHVFLPSTTFPTVRKLTLTVDECTFRRYSYAVGNKWIIWEGHDCVGDCRPTCEHELEISPEAYMELVAQLFPSVTQLTVWNRMNFRSVDGHYVIPAILQSESTLAIESFEVKGLHSLEYLRIALGGQDFANKMTNLRKVRLESSWNGIVDIVAIQQCFTLLAEHFQRLKEVKLSAVFLGRNKVERLENLELLATKFPAWHIKLI